MSDLIDLATRRASPPAAPAPVPGPFRWVRCWGCAATGLQGRGRCGPCAGFGFRIGEEPPPAPPPPPATVITFRPE